MGTIADGNCGYHAFAIVALEVADPAFQGTAIVRKLAKARKQGPLAMVRFLRGEACAWSRTHERAKLWEGMTMRQLGLFMSSTQTTWEGVLQEIGSMDTWADAAAIHVLACIFKLDVLIWQATTDPAIVGFSLWQDAEAVNQARDPPLVAIAMQNDRHFWATRSITEVLVHVDRGDWVDVAASSQPPEPCRRKRKASETGPSEPTDDGLGDSSSEEDEASGRILRTLRFTRPAVLADAQVHAELDLCIALRAWDPWEIPSADITQVVQQVVATGPGAGDPHRVLVRSCVENDLAFEIQCGDELPERMRYHGVAKNRLRHQVRGQQEGRISRRQQIEDHVEVHDALNIAQLETRLGLPCSRRGTAHSCLDAFRANVGIVRNWRVLWHSMRSSTRTELITRFHINRHASGKYGAGKGPTTVYRFCGQPVCETAFRMLAGIGGSRIQNARERAAAGLVTRTEQNEIAPIMRYPVSWMDVRGWLEACPTPAPPLPPPLTPLSLPPPSDWARPGIPDEADFKSRAAASDH